jgi:hypothetical protein
VRLSNGRLALWSARQRQAHQARCAPRLPSSFDGGSDLLGELLGRGFRGLVWRRCVVRWRVQTRTTVWFGGGRRPYVDGRRALRRCVLGASG